MKEHGKLTPKIILIIVMSSHLNEQKQILNSQLDVTLTSIGYRTHKWNIVSENMKEVNFN